YLTTGAQVRANVAVTNGQTLIQDIDLSQATYGITGTISVQSGFTMVASSGAGVTVNTLTDLLADATSQTLQLGGVQTFGPNGPQCTGGTSTQLTTARVEAFPKDINSYGQANRNGQTNCFGVGQYKYGAIAADGSYSIAGLS